MTTIDTPVVTERARRAASAAAVLRLARTEAQRILLHPVHLAFALIILTLTGTAVDGLAAIGTRSDIKGGLEYVFLLYYGPVVFFAANLVASSPRRSGVDSQLDATPVSGQARTLAVLLGTAGPVLFAGLVATGIYALTYGGATDLDEALTPAELAVIPLCALGAGLLGVAVARWLPWPGAALAVMVTLQIWVGASPDGAFWWAPWSASPTFHDDPVLLGGSQAWHAVYLAGLCILAGLAALLRHRPHRRALLAASALVAAATLAAGILQLP